MIIQNTSEGIIIVDNELQHLIWNAAMERVSGRPLEEVLGRTVFEAFPGFADHPVGHAWWEALAGTRATLYLPVSASAARTASVLLPHREEEPGSGTILIVEDDKSARDVTVEIIRDLGYETLTASNGQEALKLLRQTDVVDLLFTDLVMPGPLMGLALAREAQIMRPGLPVLLATDYASLDEQAENEFPVIAKPFRAAELSRVIARLILNKPPEADRNS